MGAHRELPPALAAQAALQSKTDASAASLGGFGQPDGNSVTSSAGLQLLVDPSLLPDSLQLHGNGGGADPHATAAGAFQGAGSSLPHQAKIESSFGTDMSSVQAYTGPAASAACESLGASAFASGNKIAFKESSPSVQLAAHEAAHVVQQSAGVQLSGGMGQAGDKYEVHADAVASQTAGGQDASGLLSSMTGGSGVQAKLDGLQAKADVQLLGDPLGGPVSGEEPAHLNSRDQRQYSVEQYVKMWEAEQGRKMNARELDTLARGCIGITALNLSGGGNPPLDNAYATFDAAHKKMMEWKKTVDETRGTATADGTIGKGEPVLFAKLFWSNQDSDSDKRKNADPSAYQPDEDGKVDMSDYKYRAQPGYINFDYGFWDEASQCFWHANHSQPGMKVYQSTKDKFSAGYMDFDRIIFCVAWAKNYKPANAATAH